MPDSVLRSLARIILAVREQCPDGESLLDGRCVGLIALDLHSESISGQRLCRNVFRQGWDRFL